MNAHQARSEGTRGPWPLLLGKFQKFCQKTFYRKIFSASIYFVHFFQVRPPPARARDKKFHFEILAPPPTRGSRYEPESVQFKENLENQRTTINESIDPYSVVPVTGSDMILYVVDFDETVCGQQQLSFPC